MTENLLIDDEIIFRTEDLKLKEIGIKFVETKKDRENIEYLKKKTPIILSGSRGTGKTMLLKMAEKKWTILMKRIKFCQYLLALVKQYL